MRVAAADAASSSRPVANGSSVPAWPTFTPLPSRRRILRDDVVRRHPGGLVDERTAVRGQQAARRACVAQELHELGELEVGGEARGAAVPAAAAARGRSPRRRCGRRSRAARPCAPARRRAARARARRPRCPRPSAGGRRRPRSSSRRRPRSGSRRASGASPSAGRRRSARRWRARAPAARACPAGCPRRGAGRSRARRCPPAISSAAISCARGPVFSYMKRPVSVTRPTYSASPIACVIGTSSAVHQVPHHLGRARRVRVDVVDRPEARVVVVVVDVEDQRGPARA